MHSFYFSDWFQLRWVNLSKISSLIVWYDSLHLKDFLSMKLLNIPMRLYNVWTLQYAPLLDKLYWQLKIKLSIRHGLIVQSLQNTFEGGFSFFYLLKPNWRFFKYMLYGKLFGLVKIQTLILFPTLNPTPIDNFLLIKQVPRLSDY